MKQKKKCLREIVYQITGAQIPILFSVAYR